MEVGLRTLLMMGRTVPLYAQMLRTVPAGEDTTVQVGKMVNRI